MFALNSVTWIGIALLTPFWWALGLFVLALLGDVSPWWRPRVSRLFERLERLHAEPASKPESSSAIAA